MQESGGSLFATLSALRDYSAVSALNWQFPVEDGRDGVTQRIGERRNNWSAIPQFTIKSHLRSHPTPSGASAPSENPPVDP